MVKKNRKKLVEAVGVPSGLHESSVKVFDLFLDFFRNVPQLTFDEQKGVFELHNVFDETLQISDLTINEIELYVNIYNRDITDDAVLARMGFNNEAEIVGDKLFSRVNTGKIKISFDFLINPEKEKEDLDKFLVRERPEIISSIAHELKHAYDAYKEKFEKVRNVARYQSLFRSSINIPPISDFMHFLYYSEQTESLVRPSEFHSLMKLKHITHKDFYDFIRSNTTWEKLTELKNWKYDDFREHLKEYDSQIREFIEHTGNEVPEDQDKLIDEILRMNYVEMSNNIINITKQMITTSFFELFQFPEEKKKIVEKVIREVLKYQGRELDFYKNQEKKFNYSSTELMKKISKVFSLIGVDI